MIDADAFNAFEAAGWENRAETYDHYWPALTSRLSDPLLDAVGAGPTCGYSTSPVVRGTWQRARRTAARRPWESTSPSQ